MAKKNVAEKQQKRLREDIASFKASVAFLLFCAVTFFTVNYLQYSRNSYRVKIWSFIDQNPWIAIISVALVVLTCVFRCSRVKAHRDESLSYFSSEDALAVALFQFMFIATFLMTTNLAPLVCVVVGFAVVYYVRYFFGRDFLLATLLNCDIAMALWLIFGNAGVTGILATASKIIFVIATVLGFFACIYALFKTFKNKKQMLDEKLSVLPAIISVVFGAVLGILLLVSGGTITLLVAEIILLAQFLGLGIYYTVRLLNQ